MRHIHIGNRTRSRVPPETAYSVCLCVCVCVCVCPSMPGVLYGIFWFSMYDILSGLGFSIVCEKIAIEFNTTHGTRCVKFYSYFFALRMSQSTGTL